VYFILLKVPVLVKQQYCKLPLTDSKKPTANPSPVGFHAILTVQIYCHRIAERFTNEATIE
jgi:hypothetical protein